MMRFFSRSATRMCLVMACVLLVMLGGLLLIGYVPSILITAQTPGADIKSALATQVSEAMKTDCWREGGHGSGASIAGYNTQLPALLAALLAQTKSQNLSSDALEALFLNETGQHLTLYGGDSDHFVAAIMPLYCVVGDHDGPDQMISVVDRSGHSWPFGYVRDISPMQWVGDRWIGTANNGFMNHFDLWVVFNQNTGWRRSELSLDVGYSPTYALADGYNTLTLTDTTWSYDAPCAAIGTMQGFYLTTYQINSTYHWLIDHYELDHRSQQPTRILFNNGTPDRDNVLRLAAAGVTSSKAQEYTLHDITDWTQACNSLQLSLF